MRSHASLCLSTLAALSLAQAPSTLDAFLRGYRADTLLAVAPETLRADGKRLDSYDRMAVRIGAVTAIVPRTAVSFDDTLARPRNRYVGLPRKNKVLLLLGTLDAKGWAKAAGPGIGLDDLKGEPRAILASILPKSLAWRERRVGEGGLNAETLGEGRLQGADATHVRLRIERGLHLMVPLNESGGGFFPIFTVGPEGVPGDVRLERQETADERNDEVFGYAMRSEAPNRPKKGQLDVDALKGSVRLPEKATVGEALRAIGEQNGREILCDLRVRDLSVFHTGGAIRSGDLARALALAVGGAYRRIGGSYALVSDVAGLGQRQLRQRDWREMVQDDVDRVQAGLRKAIGEGSLLDGVDYDPANRLAPGAALRPYLGSHPAKRPTDPAGIPASELTPEQRALIERVVRRNPGRRLDPSHVEARGTLRFRFVLPDGRALQPEAEDLGIALDPPTNSPQRDVVLPAPLDPLADPPTGGPAVPVIVRLQSRAEAATVVREARAHGIREIWVETDRKDALQAAVASGLGVRLVVRPWVWRAASEPAVADRNILGHGGYELVRSLATDRENRRRVRSGLSGDRPPEIVLSPDDPSWGARKEAWKGLASTPGLAGVVVLDSQPRGYEPTRTTSVTSGYGATLATKSMLGYTDSERLAFFRQHGIDPIDLGAELLRGDIDLNPPFFPDAGLSSYRSLGNPTAAPSVMATALAEWDRFRWRRNAAAVNEMLQGLPRLPVAVAVRGPSQNEPLGGTAVVTAWDPEKPLPAVTRTVEKTPDGREVEALSSVPPDAREIYTVVDGDLREFRAYGKVATDGLSEGRPGAILDLSLLPVKGIGTRLDKIFVRRTTRR